MPSFMDDENLKSFLQRHFSDTLYVEIAQKKILIFVLPSEKESDKEATLVRKFIFSDGKIYEYNENFKILNNEEFSNFLKTAFDETKLLINHYQDLLEHKENTVLKGKIVANFFRKSFILKQKILKIMKFIMQSNESLKSLCNDLVEFKGLLKLHLITASNLEKTAHELLYRLDGLYNLISSIKSEKTNKNIYILSIISTIVLPLNLIVGFFGMNTGGLFLSQNPYGTVVVTFFIATICLCGVWYYRYKTKQDLSLDENFNFEITKTNLNKSTTKPTTKAASKPVLRQNLNVDSK